MSARRPNRLHVVEGNPSHKAKAELEKGLKVPPQAPSEPDWRTWFPASAAGPERRRLIAESKRCREDARGCWRHYVPQLDRHGVVSSLDLEVLTTLCRAVARRNQIERRLSIEGLETLGQRGQVRHRLTSVLKTYEDTIHRCCIALGLTPAARDGFAPSVPSADGSGLSPWDV
jgi:P27 family predicted phage terminase small subunit